MNRRPNLGVGVVDGSLIVTDRSSPTAEPTGDERATATTTATTTAWDVVLTVPQVPLRSGGGDGGDLIHTAIQSD